MFCANVLYPNTSFNSRTFFGGNIALTTDIPSATKKQGLFLKFICIHKVQKNKNKIAIEQESSQRGCTVKPLKGVGKKISTSVNNSF